MSRCRSTIILAALTTFLFVSCTKTDNPVNEPTPQESDYTHIRDFYVHLQGDMSYVSGDGLVDEAFNVSDFVINSEDVYHNYPWIVRNYSFDVPIPKTGTHIYSHDTMIVRNTDLWCKEKTEIRISEDGTTLERIYQRLETFRQMAFGWESRSLCELELVHVPFQGPWNTTGYMRCWIGSGSSTQIRMFTYYDVTDFKDSTKRTSIIVLQNPRLDSGFVDIGIQFGK